MKRLRLSKVYTKPLARVPTDRDRTGPSADINSMLCRQRTVPPIRRLFAVARRVLVGATARGSSASLPRQSIGNYDPRQSQACFATRPFNSDINGRPWQSVSRVPAHIPPATHDADVRRQPTFPPPQRAPASWGGALVVGYAFPPTSLLYRRRDARPGATPPNPSEDRLAPPRQ